MTTRRSLSIGLAASMLAPQARAQAGDVFWPVVTDHPDWNLISAAPSCARLRCFGAPRPVSRLRDPLRRHVGVDLFANAGDGVVAIEAGWVIDAYPFLRARTGQMSYALLIAHAGYVANYGEVRRPASVSVGETVAAGQPLAIISDTAQLHFETYSAGASRNRAWPHGAPRPPGVIDPTPRLRDLARRGVRLRP